MFADSGGDDGEFTLADSDVAAGKWGPPNPRETEKVASMHEMLSADIEKVKGGVPYELVRPHLPQAFQELALTAVKSARPVLYWESPPKPERLRLWRHVEAPFFSFFES